MQEKEAEEGGGGKRWQLLLTFELLLLLKTQSLNDLESDETLWVDKE